jgi:hypothetical protein
MRRFGPPLAVMLVIVLAGRGEDLAKQALGPLDGVWRPGGHPSSVERA